MNDTLLARARQRVAQLAPLEPLLYAAWAAALTLWCACQFYSSMRLQTAYADLFRYSDRAFEAARAGALGPWSAPLDDVFIHFDFARQAARGHAFEWSQGAGYSSGGTSLLYPFLLVPGFWLNFRGLNLMIWAAVVACVSVFGGLLALRRLFRGLPKLTSYLLPPLLLSVGALDWSFWSGMEVALLLGIWALAIVAWDDLRVLQPAAPGYLARSFALGAAGLLLCATRPEAIGAQGVLALTALWPARHALRRAGVAAGLSLAPALALLVAHGFANRAFTSDSSAAGALVKLELYHPYLSRAEVLEKWWYFFTWQVKHITHYHLAYTWWTGWALWLLAGYALWAKRTRAVATMLWLTMLAWLSLVALNGQVAWQNTRYAMPTVIGLLCCAALGAGVAFVEADFRTRQKVAPALAAAALLALFGWQQQPRFTDQLWFFGRASRNIYDQHVQAGRKLRDEFRPQPSRVLVGDAGAMPYISDLPALDIIGLGGFHGLPFARATRQHVAAGIELIERLKAADRPDILAIYPSWWGDFPLWFGERLDEVPVRGNVICGGASKVLYRPRWESLDHSEDPVALRGGERKVDGVDMADLVSEKAHGYALSNGSVGHVAMKLLPHPQRPREDLWDAGRIVPAGVRESFVLSGLDPAKPVTLIVRAAPTELTELSVEADPNVQLSTRLSPRDGWLEERIELGTPGVSQLAVRLSAPKVEHIFFHAWAVQPD
ncbi:MAG TPA: hypothetical protein VHB79_22720 [Polyangiaceae bacterium]|nr:hypothetical protein [Polyangiaceae bacterium]